MWAGWGGARGRHAELVVLCDSGTDVCDDLQGIEKQSLGFTVFGHLAAISGQR